ncbi:MAG: hypothetical protein GDA36_05270 [Rhodobacteraceae bacterium]|nr:hypothetical protein [Paracoccaceae bacterium]
MERVFFRYVWMPPDNPAWPLSFKSKGVRAHVRKVLTKDNLVFTVGTKNKLTAPQHQGRVLGIFKLSDLEVSLQDYDLQRTHDNPAFDTVMQSPFALHPIAGWVPASPDNMFADLVGPLTPEHHLQAQSGVCELDEKTAKPLLALERRQLTIAVPNTPPLAKG